MFGPQLEMALKMSYFKLNTSANTTINQKMEKNYKSSLAQ